MSSNPIGPSDPSPGGRTSRSDSDRRTAIHPARSAPRCAGRSTRQGGGEGEDDEPREQLEGRQVGEQVDRDPDRQAQDRANQQLTQHRPVCLSDERWREHDGDHQAEQDRGLDRRDVAQREQQDRSGEQAESQAGRRLYPSRDQDREVNQERGSFRPEAAERPRG